MPIKEWDAEIYNKIILNYIIQLYSTFVMLNFMMALTPIHDQTFIT